MARGARACRSPTGRRSSETSRRSHEFEPELAIGTTPVVQKAKERAIPALYFTNLISARPLMGAAGAGSLAQVVNTALRNRPRFDAMKGFFDGVGAGDTAGVWQDTPKDHAPVPRALPRSAREGRGQAQIRGDDLMLVLDHDRAGGYWGSVYVFTAIKGLQVIIDGPVGCENLPVTSVLHYTDGLPPHELPIVVTGLAEEELGQHGTEGAMRRAHRTLSPDSPAVVVTGSIAEMIGGGVTPEGTNIQRFLPRTIDEDQWQSANRAMSWLWSEYGKKRIPERKPAQGGREAARQYHRTDVRHIQYAERSRRNSPADRGHRRRGQPDVPARQPSRGRAAIGGGRRERLPVSRVRPLLVRDPGAPLSAGADRAAQHDQIPAQARARSWGSIRRPFHRARKAYDHQAALGPVALGDPGLLRHRELRRRRNRDLRTRHPPFPGNRDGPAVHVLIRAPRRRETRQRGGAQRQFARTPPLILFGSFNERMYLAQSGARAMYIPASFPGTIIRRHTGTPFMGYGGATYIVQEVCNALFDALFNILPLSTELDQVDATPSRLHRELPWTDEAMQALG